MSLTPEEMEQGSRLFELVVPIGKWVAGTAAAAWVAMRWTIRSSMRVGEEKKRYEDLVSLVDKFNDLDLDSLVRTVAQLKIDSTQWITRTQHDDMQRICQGDIERMIDSRLHRAILEWRDELAALNANVCHIMGALNIKPIDQGKRRRQSDGEDD